MATLTDRQPPRFVPTLTEVVKNSMPSASATAETSASIPIPTSPVTAMPERTSTIPVPASASSALPDTPKLESDAIRTAVMTEQIVQRVMVRVESVLQERLYHVLSEVVQAHTHALYQGLRHEVESIVCQTVSDAVIQEIQAPLQAPASGD